MDHQQSKVALVTGASSGIGLAFAHIFAKQGYNVVLVARRKSKLEEVARIIKHTYQKLAYVIESDLSKPNEAEKILSQLQEQGLHVDALVNCAGYAIKQAFLEVSWQAHADLIQVNNTAIVQLCHLFGQKMRDNNYGRIINVASMSAFMPQVKGSLYGATKSFVVDFSQALDIELKEYNVHCTALCPGFTRSEFHERMDIQHQVNKTIPSLFWMEAERVAKAGYDAVMNGESVHIAGLINKSMFQVFNHLPLAIKNFIAKRQPAFD